MGAPRALVLRLLLLGWLGGAASGQGREAAAQPVLWAQSGQFSTRERHVCSWQLVPAGEATELRLSCRGPAGGSGEGLRCAYRGQPERCAAYSGGGRQYWKQILGKLRRKRHPCQDGGPLKARLCGGKGSPEAQLRLLPPSPSPAGPVRGRAKGRGQEAATLQQAGAEAESGAVHARSPEKRRKAGKRKGNPGSPSPPDRRPPTAAESPEPPTEVAEDPAEAYCAEQWHSLCRFFVNFWNG